MTVLGIDYGRARLGLAISDASGLLASPLETLAVKHPRAAIPTLKEIARARQIETIVVGLPLDANGEDGDMAKEVRAWAGSVARATGARIVFVDERFTSQWTDRIISERESRGQRRALHERHDALAAAAILQTHLDASRMKAPQ